MDGTERMILVHHLAHPWGLAVHGPFLYYSDEQYEVIERVDKSSGSNKVVLRDNVPSLRGLQVYHRRSEYTSVSPRICTLILTLIPCPRVLYFLVYTHISKIIGNI